MDYKVLIIYILIGIFVMKRCNNFMFSYNKRKFKVVSQSENSEVSKQSIFEYFQEENILWCNYSNANVVKGNLLGMVDSKGNISMVYHQINKNNEIKTGTCNSRIEVLPTGKVRLHESWQWTSGDNSQGHSILEEI